MRKAIAILLLVVLSILIAACGVRSESDEAIVQEAEERREERNERFLSNSIEIHDDSATGCRYLIYRSTNAGGATALLKADGTPDCGN